jgi:protein SCO1
METVTRRTAFAMGAAPALAAAAAYVLGERANGGGGRPRFEASGSPREALQRHDLVKDRRVVLTFFSSRALEESFTMTRNLAALQRLFGTRIGRDMFLYSIARTPERDTPAALGNWAAQSGAGRGWTFLSGRPADVETLRHGLGFTSDDPAEDADPRTAIGMVRYGSEPEMRWAHCQSQARPRVLAHSMVLDFGTGPADAGSPITRTFGTGANPAAAPVWNCRLLLRGV